MRLSGLHAPLPVIVARRADRKDRGWLAWITVENETVHLRLEDEPRSDATHVLEIHVESFSEPLVVLAQPLGPTTSEGSPLRLSPLDEVQAASLNRELFGGPVSEPDRGSNASRRSTSSAPPRSQRDSAATLTLSAKLEAFGEAVTMPPPSSGEDDEPNEPEDYEPPASRRVELLSGRVFGEGRFTLGAFLGAGASGEVYRAWYTTLQRDVAVKVLHPSLQRSIDYCRRFYAEALAASQLDHRNVLRIIDYGQESDGALYIVMELLVGRSLQQILDDGEALPLHRIVDLVSQACAGLAHAHDLGVIHRDVKPENIVVVQRRDDEERDVELVKVCDFGIAHWAPPARLVHDDDDDTLINKPDATKVVGTPAYMAPEQVRNDTVDARTDVYAMGVVLYELVAGRVPFLSNNPLDIVFRHVTTPPEPPSVHAPDVNPALERIILKALSKDPADRQADTRALRAELRALVDDDRSTSSSSQRKLLARRRI